MSTPTSPNPQPPLTRRDARIESQATRKRGDERETKILDSLRALLEDQPLTDISMADIAAGAGLSRPSVYHYVTSRSEAFVALLSRTLRELSTPPQELVGTPGLTPPQQISGLLRHVLRSWQEHGPVLRAVVEGVDDPAAGAVWRQAMGEYTDFLAQWIQAHRQSGTAHDTGDDPGALAAALTWMVERNNYQLYRTGPPSSAELDRHVATLTGIVLRSTGVSDPT